ncbi:MAG TPA: MBL fold metallo-hydrolase [Solirubrobacteraceae bacterium]|jgi:glyoxylase-like metal-dependent hydrolase (beta-lactamase superfamily II)|nr:MBL fold metallo-hydrolase [Solirubrobacteraceae bacterium]
MDSSEMRDGAPQLIDVRHLGREQVIGAWRVGDVLIDPGPSSSVDTLLPMLDADPPRAIALTHIHLDHAGAAGTLARRYPQAEVWVHERGAPHLADPSRLLASAQRLYGEDMQRLWGEFLAVPHERLRVLRGGERLGPFAVAYTPGHASHHVSYLHEPSGRAFAGDVAGVRIGDGAVLAPTPPPDIDLPAWRASLDTLQAWRPRSLAVTHFGAFDDVSEHLADLRAHLDEVEAWAGEGDEASFIARLRARAGADAGESAGAYVQALPAEQSYQGLERYLRKRAGG